MKNIDFYWLIFSLILFKHINCYVSTNPNVCTIQPSIFQTCLFENVVPGFSFNLWSDTTTSTTFTTCEHLVMDEIITPSATPFCVRNSDTEVIEFLDCPSYTGDISFCGSNNCINVDPVCYCSYYTRETRPRCNTSFFVEHLNLIELVEHYAAGFVIYDILQLSFDIVNPHNLFIKDRTNGFNVVLPYFGNYYGVIQTPFETIHLNFTDNVLNYNFPQSYNARSFPYRLSLYDGDTLQHIYTTLSFSDTDNFCNNPDCYMCTRAFKNFNCLDGLHKFVLISSTILFLLLSISVMVVVFIVLAYIIKKFTCLLKRYLPSKQYNHMDELPTNNKPSDINFIKKISYKIPFVKKSITTTEEVNYFVNLFKSTDMYNSALTSRDNIVSFNNYLMSRKILFKGNPQYLFSVFVIVCLLIVQAHAQCDIGSTSIATVSNCISTDSNTQTCTLQLSITASLDRILNVFCSALFDQTGHEIGMLRIGYIEAFYDIYYNIEYYTAEWDPVTQSNFRCYSAPGSHCSTDDCNNVDRTAYGNLDDPNLALTFGVTHCDRVSPSGLSCFLPTYGCLFSGWGILPNPNTLTGVFRKTSTSPVKVQLFYEIIAYEVRESGFVYVTPGEPVQLPLMEIQVDSGPNPSVDPELNLITFPRSKTSSVINPAGVYTSEKIGDVQSETPNSFVNPVNFQSITTNTDSIIISKQIQSHSAHYIFHNSGLQHQQNSNYKLPSMIDHVYYSPIYLTEDVSGFQYVRANLTNPSGITFTIIGEFNAQRQLQSCTFSIELKEVHGCCDCSTGAFITYDIVYISEVFCNVYFTSNDVDIETPVNNDLNKIYFHTSSCSQTISIRATSGSFHTDVSIDIVLEQPVIDSFSNGVTTINDISSEEYHEPGIKNGIKSFFTDKFNTHNVLHWTMLIFFILLGIFLTLLILYCFAQCVMQLAMKMFISYRKDM